MSATTQRREFRVDRHAITSLIQAQAGSLEKAILEAVANALDAGASQVKVDLTPERVVIEDNGKGFKTMEEIESFFDTFGFDHSQLDRTVGRFGIGRGQLFNFGKNLWTTHGFTMGVDHRKDGFGYDLGQAAKPHKGVRIEIDLYDPMSFSDLAATEANLRRLVKFCTIPVIFNGKPAHKDPAKMKWDAENEDAWFLFDDSYELKVYSQGLYVQGMSSHKYGKGGIVVTKTGKALTQNMARNDLLASSCPVWKRVDKELRKLAGQHQEKAKKSNVLTEAMRSTLAKDALHSTETQAMDNLYKVPLFTLTNGKHVRLASLLSAGFVASAPSNDPAADLLIQRKQAYSITPGTLHRFGVETVKQLEAALQKTIKRHVKETDQRSSHGYSGNNWQEEWERRKAVRLAADGMKKCQFFEKVAELPMRANVALVEVEPSEYSAEEKMVMAQLRKTMLPYLSNHVRICMREEGVDMYAPLQVRQLALASSEAFVACTDGASKIWLERGFLKKCISQGAKGFVELGNTIVHELLHDIDTSTGHAHDMAFYEAYHDTTVDGRVAEMALAEYRTFLRHGGRAPSRNIKEMEAAGWFGTEEAMDRLSAARNKETIAEAVVSEASAPEPVAARPRRKSPR